MKYQQIITGDEPYFLYLGESKPFPEHRHADVEIYYCSKGRVHIAVDKKPYLLESGDVVLINPMVPHEIFEPEGESLTLTATVGSFFLKKHFIHFARARSTSVLFKLGERGSYFGELRALLDETVLLLRGSGYKKDLLCKGNLYKICSYLIEAISDGSSSEGDEEVSLRLVANVERALDLIHYAYPKPLTVEDAAEATGYGKSNFCKIFKSIVGKSFHRVLNEHRVKKAAEMLLETDMQISHIASEVGFSEAKTFCRVFKSVTGKTPGEYRKTANL